MKRLLQILIGTLSGLIVALVLVWPRTDTPVSSGFEPYPAPDFTLETHDGAPLSLSDLRGRTVALFFGYTHCPDVCPLTLSKLSDAASRTETSVQVLFVTVDPERDSPERLSEYLTAIDPDFIGLHGTIEQIRGVTEAYGVFFQRSTENEETFDHSARTFLIDPEGQVAESFLHDASSDEILALVELVDRSR